MAVITLKNQTNSTINYLSGTLSIGANGQAVVPSISLHSLSLTPELISDIRNGNIVINDGLLDRAYGAAISYLKELFDYPIFQSITDVYTETGSGTIANVFNNPARSFSVTVAPGGIISSWIVTVEGSLDGINWTSILTHTNITPGLDVILFSATNLSPVLYFRTHCSVLTLGIGTNISVTCLGIP